MTTDMVPGARTRLEWVVCHGATRDVVDGAVACPLAAGRPIAAEQCEACHHLALLSDERRRENYCSTGEPINGPWAAM